MHQCIGNQKNVSQLLTDLVKDRVPYGWMTFSVLHLTSCCLSAHTVDLGIQTVLIRRMWFCTALVLLVVSLRYKYIVRKYNLCVTWYGLCVCERVRGRERRGGGIG